MPVGPGTYDDLCTEVREEAEAEAVLVCVINGNRGTGFSVQSQAHIHPLVIADILETVVKQMRTDFQNG